MDAYTIGTVVKVAKGKNSGLAVVQSHKGTKNLNLLKSDGTPFWVARGSVAVASAEEIAEFKLSKNANVKKCFADAAAAAAAAKLTRDTAEMDDELDKMRVNGVAQLKAGVSSYDVKLAQVAMMQQNVDRAENLRMLALREEENKAKVEEDASDGEDASDSEDASGGEEDVGPASDSEDASEDDEKKAPVDDNDCVHHLPIKKWPKTILDHYPNACGPDYNEAVIEYAKTTVVKDKTYKKPKSVHQTIQAGAISYGAMFWYKNEKWSATPIPTLFQRLNVIANELTGREFDIVLLKVYEEKQSLGRHQDVDGSDMDVACFTFFEAGSKRAIDFNPGKGEAKTGAFTITPEPCSMWFMGGTTNSQWSHRVRPIEGRTVATKGLRVSVSFRRSQDLPEHEDAEGKGN